MNLAAALWQRRQALLHDLYHVRPPCVSMDVSTNPAAIPGDGKNAAEALGPQLGSAVKVVSVQGSPVAGASKG